MSYATTGMITQQFSHTRISYFKIKVPLIAWINVQFIYRNMSFCSTITECYNLHHLVLWMTPVLNKMSDRVGFSIRHFRTMSLWKEHQNMQGAEAKKEMLIIFALG